MPDPHKDLAPVIEPLAPPPTHSIATDWLPWGGSLALALAAGLLALWWYRRHAPVKALRRLSRSDDPRAGADALAQLVRRYKLRPDAAWQADLERLRFARPGEHAPGELARLCQAAQDMLGKH